MFDESTTPDELLHAFIDDELAPELEERFYAELAADAELRARLRQMRAIRGEARRFRTAAAPPHDLSDAVFSRLGFAPQATASPVRALGAAILMHRAWVPMASAAAAAIITATLIFSLLDFPTGRDDGMLAVRPPAAPGTEFPTAPAGRTGDIQDERLRSTDALVGDAQPSPAVGSNHAGPAPIATSAIFSGTDAQHADNRRTNHNVSSSAGDESTALTETGNSEGREVTPRSLDAAATMQQRPALAEVGRPRSDVAEGGQQSTGERQSIGERQLIGDGRRAAESGMEEAVPAAAYVETPDFWAAVQTERNAPRDGSIDAMQAGNGLPLTGDQAVDTRQYFPLLRGTPLLRFVTVELRGINATSFPATDMGTASNPWMQNMAVAVFYSQERDDYGLEFGQEAFAQHYSGIEYGKAVAYEQNLLTSWILAGFRHRFRPLFGDVEPYVSIGAGATIQAWPLARAGAGFMYMPDRRVRFHLGLEGALLAYPFQEQWFSTERVGLSYGISLLF